MSFGCCDVSLIILAHFPEFVVFVHSASKTFVVLGVFCGLLEKTDVAPVLDVLFSLFTQERTDVNEHFLVKSRKREICDVRMIALKIFRDETDYPYQAIGRIFGKHHATIIHNIRWAGEYIKTDKKFAHDYELLLKTFQKFLSE